MSQKDVTLPFLLRRTIDLTQALDKFVKRSNVKREPAA
jgi:hypothetical protein